MSTDSKFSIKNTVRNEEGELVAFTAWENGKKLHFSRTLFDPSDPGPAWIQVVVQWPDGKKQHGKVNIGSYDRLSDFLVYGPNFIPFCDTNINGQKGKFTIINKTAIRDITPTAGERALGKPKIKKWVNIK